MVGTAAPATAPALRSSLVVPSMIANADDRAALRFLVFLRPRSRTTTPVWPITAPRARFSPGSRNMGSVTWPISSHFHVADYLKALRVSDAGDRSIKQRIASRPTVKQHLAAIRMLFDWLVVGHALTINPAHAVRGPKHVVKRGNTPVLTEDQARHLLTSIKLTRNVSLLDDSEAEMPSLVGLRDRALIGVMVYSFASISAVVATELRISITGTI